MTDVDVQQIIQYLSWIDSHGYTLKYQFLSLFDLLTFILGCILGIAFAKEVSKWI